MTTFSSTALPFKTWALAQIRGLADLDGVQVSWGWPGRNIETELVMLGSIEWGSEGWASLGARQRQEDYTISLYVNVRRVGDSDQEAQRRSLEILGVIEEWLRANALPSTQIGARALTAELIPRNARTAPFDGGTEAQVEAAISVSARI